MEEPNKKWWPVTKQDVGREFGNPNWVEWSAEKIKDLKEENKKWVEWATQHKMGCMGWQGREGEDVLYKKGDPQPPCTCGLY